MRKLDLVNVGPELYEVIKRVPFGKFTKEISGENADVLKEYYRSEKILKSNQTNEYLFVNLIPEAQIESDYDQQRASESQS
jgi:hypothetical protein